MYACMHVCMYVYVHTYSIYIYIYIHIYIHISVSHQFALFGIWLICLVFSFLLCYRVIAGEQYLHTV